MKRLISLLLAAILLLSMPFAAFAAEGGFTDVSKKHWAYEAIQWAQEEGLMTGTGNGAFSPNGVVSRAQLVTVLWRMEGEPAPTKANPFKDLTQSWYKKAVIWANEAGVVKGTGDGTTFTPNGTLTRETAATMFRRYSEYKGYDISDSADLSSFADGKKVSKWAKDGLAWANAEGLITGVKENGVLYLKPQGEAGRAQLATILQRYDTNIVEEPVEKPQPEPKPEPKPEPIVPITEGYYYQNLTAKQQAAYKKLEEAVKNWDYQVNLGGNFQEDAFVIYCAFMGDHPEHFFLGRTAGISDGNNTVLFLCYSDGINDNLQKEHGVAVGINAPSEKLMRNIRTKKEAFDQEVNKIVNMISPSLSAVERQKWIHDYIIKNATYDMSAALLPDLLNLGAPDQWTAYGVLMNRKGVCESYAEAFQLLCHRVGIQCTGVVGTAFFDYQAGPHKWNAVLLDGEWYLCDLTYDDPYQILNGKPQNHLRYDAFNRTDAQMSQTHKPDAAALQNLPAQPTCTGTKYSYENCFNK